MSATKYGAWRHLFVPQKKLEAALVAGAESLAELAEALVQPKRLPEILPTLVDRGGHARDKLTGPATAVEP
jgi:hypothetical protein